MESEVHGNFHGSKNNTGDYVVDPISLAARVDTRYVGRLSRKMPFSFEEVTCGQERRHRRQASCRSRHVRPTSLGTFNPRRRPPGVQLQAFALANSFGFLGGVCAPCSMCDLLQ